jgi:hypothetical protein
MERFRQEMGGTQRPKLRLTNLETYVEDGKRLFIGIWRAGTDAHYLWAGVEWSNFNAKWDELRKRNLRLVDLKTYVENGKRLYAGVWRAGIDAHYLWVGVKWDSFHAKWEQLGQQNLRLVDLEIYSSAVA